ncbi:hypothetical protein V865_001222 [Kwoniella europaea PYCC6329]|uniref:Uncharacterized protein n=1 Tax=Kwoniella europaea PYCC6329 TaxID=1423913 RepID=A0AAX4KCC8_9TREE
MPPSLIYHSLNPTLYPTNNANETLLVVRFNGPTRISSVRVIPEGVGIGNLARQDVNEKGNVGTTYPPQFTAQLLFNISPSNPVNALASTTIEVIPREHALDYPIDMPIGVTTRMMMLRSPAQKLSLSIYGYQGDSLNTIEEQSQLPITRAQPVHSARQTKKVGEDFSWLYTWSGPSPPSLFSLLDESVPLQISNRAIECLTLLAQVQVQSQAQPGALSPSVISLLLDKPTALRYIMTTDSLSAIPLKDRMLSDPESALHPNISPYLPTDHPLALISKATRTEERHSLAMKKLSSSVSESGLDVGALIALQDISEHELLNVETGKEKSNLMRLMELANDMISKIDKGIEQDETVGCLGKILDILNKSYRHERLNEYLARNLPRLVVWYNLRQADGKRKLEIPLDYSQEVIRSLGEIRSQIIDGQSTKFLCDELAGKYLDKVDDEDPLKKIFTNESSTQTLSQDVDTDIEVDADQRRLNRLSQSLLTSSFNSSSLIHSITPSELISLLSPELYKSLSTSRTPPFGITPSVQSSEMEQGAKSFAGKVYTHHEFRRDRNDPSSSLGSGYGLGISGATMGGMGGMGGLGAVSSAGGGGRAASRHVDSWTR